MNPDLLPIPSDVGNLTDAQRSSQGPQSAPAIVALTAPMPNTKVAQDRVFVCSVPFASMHRTDGKKLPFVKGYLKTNIAEDIRFLQSEIDSGNPYLKVGDEQDIINCELVYNPMAAVEHRVRKQLESSIRTELEEKIRMEMDSAKMAGIDGVNINRQGVNTVQVPRINPVSTAKIAGASPDSNSIAAQVAAKLAAAHANKN